MIKRLLIGSGRFLARAVLSPSAGRWIALGIVALVAGRALWVSASRPAHRHEIATAFGSAGPFSGAPQADGTGQHVTFVQESDQGLAVFLCDTTTGQAKVVHEEREGQAGLGLRVWPWSPDTGAFAYSVRTNLVIGRLGPGSKSTRATIPPEGISALTWVDPGTIVCLGGKGGLHLLRNEAGIVWRGKRLLRTNLLHVSSLTPLGPNGVAWQQGNRIWCLNLASNTPSVLLDLATVADKGDALQSFSCCRQTGQLLLTVTHRGHDYLLQMTPGSQGGPVRLPAPATARAGLWLNGANGGSVCISAKPDNNSLLVQSAAFAEPVRLFTLGDVRAFTASGDGRRLFILGVSSNEPSSGIWEYDVASEKLRCVVPWTDRPSPYARRLDAQHGSLLVRPSRRLIYYNLYLPAGFDRRSTKKYPLVLGCTVCGPHDVLYQSVPRGPLWAQTWAQAVANCGAYVVIVTRPNWGVGIRYWGQNVMAAYERFVNNPTVDRDRVFLFGASSETQYLSEVLEKHPGLWKGVLMLNPGALPDLSRLARGQPGPRLFVSLGELEHGEGRMKSYQQEALRHGIPVELVVHKGATHWLQIKPAVRERTEAMIRFLFDE